MSNIIQMNNQIISDLVEENKQHQIILDLLKNQTIPTFIEENKQPKMIPDFVGEKLRYSSQLMLRHKYVNGKITTRMPSFHGWVTEKHQLYVKSPDDTWYFYKGNEKEAKERLNANKKYFEEQDWDVLCV